MSYSIAFGDFDRDPEYYHLPEEGALHTAIKLALRLGKPLLLSGEPGTGKTQLAHYIAWYLHKLSEEHSDFPVAFLKEPFVFNTKTTSTAKELFYEYDAIGHFHDKSGEKKADHFINLKAMGLSVLQTLGKTLILKQYPGLVKIKNLDAITDKAQSSVLLIDEVDKAPRDFPNDLLNEIEYSEFHITELDTKLQRSKDRNARMLVILTSNNEKNLPEAFLRRCIFYHIAYFDNKDILLDILLKRMKPFLNEFKLSYDEQVLMENYKKAIAFFLKSRGIAAQKKPSTNELLDWVKVLHLHTPLGEQWNLDDLDPQDKESLYVTLGVLFKHQKDIELFKKQL